MENRSTKQLSVFALLAASIALISPSLAGRLVITAQDGDWASVDGDYEAASPVEPDTLVVLDASAFPPKAIGQVEIEHSVIAPPMAIAPNPDETLALVAAPKKLDPTNPKKLIDDTFLQIVDLSVTPMTVNRLELNLPGSLRQRAFFSAR